MLQTLRNAWKIKEIRNKILFVVMILVLYRIGTVIPVPFVDSSNFDAQFGDTILAFMDTLSGGALGTATLFALGISPYITASIVMQLLTVALPYYERLAKLGEEGKKIINRHTRVATVLLAIVTGFGYYMLLKNNGMLVAEATSRGTAWTVFYGVVIVTCFCAGAAIVMWLAEKINESGIGNGISLILFVNIIASAPSFVMKMYQLIKTATGNLDMGASTAGFAANYAGGKGTSIGLYVTLAILFAVMILFVVLAMTVFSIFVTGSERKIKIQYAKRVVGRKMYGGQNSELPLKLNMSGVMPVIFASSIVSLPATIMMLAGTSQTSGVYKFFSPNGWFYPLLLFVLIIAFAYFYIQISFNPVEVSNNLKKNGGMIPGIRQGRPTAEFISKILSKVTLMGALFLSIVAVLPIIAQPLVISPVIEALLDPFFQASSYVTKDAALASAVNYFASTFTFGGTSLLIVIGVAIETERELEAQLTMRNYKGFLS